MAIQRYTHTFYRDDADYVCEFKISRSRDDDPEIEEWKCITDPDFEPTELEMMDALFYADDAASDDEWEHSR